MLARDRDARLQIQPTRPRWWAAGIGFALGVMVGGTLVGLRACRHVAAAGCGASTATGAATLSLGFTQLAVLVLAHVEVTITPCPTIALIRRIRSTRDLVSVGERWWCSASTMTTTVAC